MALIQKMEATSFENESGEFLDININYLENYIELDLETSTKFAMTESDFNQFVKSMKSVFKSMKKP